MTLSGSRPLSPSLRRHGNTSLPVRNTRSDALRPQDTVLFQAKKYQVLQARKEGQRWNVILQRSPTAPLRSVTRPAGYVWPVLAPAPSVPEGQQ